MSYNTLIFDLDGTLLNTLDDLTNSINYSLNKLNFPPRSSEEICSFVGNGIEKLIELSLPEKTSYDQFAKCLFIFQKHYSENMKNKTRPYNGIIDLLQYLKENNYNMAIVSNKFQEGVTDLNNYYFSDYIDVAIGKSPEMRKKPYPDTILAAIDKLGASKENCLYIGDSEVAIKTAQNTKIKCVGVDWGFRGKDLLQELGADYVIDTPHDLISII